MRIASFTRLGTCVYLALLSVGGAGCSDRAEDCSVLLHCTDSSGGAATEGGSNSVGGQSMATGGTAGVAGANLGAGGSNVGVGGSNVGAAGATGGRAEGSGGSDAMVESAGAGGADDDDDGDEMLGGSAGAGGDGGVEYCDSKGSPSTTPCVVDEAYAVFVAPVGVDTASGTRHAPVRTLDKAVELAQMDGKFVIACNGIYDAPLVIRAGVSLFGGFDCPGTVNAWTYVSGSVAHVTPSEKGAALSINAVKEPVVIEDFEFRALDATSPGESSIAAAVVGSPNVALRRVRLIAGVGKAGTDGKNPGYEFPAVAALEGNPGTETAGGAAKRCECPDGSMTIGGPAGSPPEQSGGAGTPAIGMAGGEGGDPSLSCSKGGGGNDGAPGTSAADGKGAGLLGTLMTMGWMPAAGTAGRSGGPGQGGGGGAGKPGGGGGGGGCGACGGQGGQGGKGGGASIALLAYESFVLIDGGELTAAAAGNGGRGAAGQAGQAMFGGGGDGAGTGDAGCDGGNGGPGGNGGSGGGGAGGISVGVVYKGTAPTISGNTTVSTSTAGAPGAGGKPGTNDGIKGVSQATLQVQQ